MNSQYFSQNLRTLLQKYASLAEGARIIGINRQQLNKYLNGSSFPSARTLNRIASALDVNLDMLLAEPLAVERAVQQQQTPPTRLEGELQDAFNLSIARSIRDEQILASCCGDYIAFHRTGASQRYLIASYMRIYQRNQKTFVKSLVTLRRRHGAFLGQQVHKHESIAILNSGCLHLLRNSRLAGDDTDLGLMILNMSRLSSDRYLFGHTLTTSISEIGRIVPSPVVLKKVSGNVLRIFRDQCGPWEITDPKLDARVRDIFTENSAVLA
nr:helix-turn-helix transcriptional regulator [uncultured Celeribacter sp.]